MHVSLRTYLVAGVAAVGAGVIAMTPTAPPAPVAAPQPASTDVALGAAILPLPSPTWERKRCRRSETRSHQERRSPSHPS